MPRAVNGARISSNEAAPGSDLGLYSNAEVFLIENHDEAFDIWQEAGVERRTLVHIDAHHDLYGSWTDAEDKNISIANYIFAAIEYDMVDQIYWVVPTESWASARYRKDVLHAVQTIVAENCTPVPNVQLTDANVRSVIFGKPLIACTLDNLPILDEDVLLDIDVDYFVIPNIGYRDVENYAELPWCWPADLVTQLATKRVSSDLVTIAYSVEGGYTPLQWKYLGDELAARLHAPHLDTVDAGDLMRDAASCASRGDKINAEESYRLALELKSLEAAAYFHLAHLRAAQERNDEEEAFYQQARSADPTYRTAFNSSGIWYYSNEKYTKAKLAHRRILQLNPSDAYAHLGLGMMAVDSKKWAQAEEMIRTTITLDDHCVDAHRLLGFIFTKTGREQEAITSYEMAIKLALSGEQSVLDGEIYTSAQPAFRSDPWHASIHRRLAHLYARQGDIRTAIHGTRMAIAFGSDGFQSRSYLTFLYLKMHEWVRAGQAGFQAIRVMPKSMWASCQYQYDRLQWQSKKTWTAFKKRRRPPPPSLWH